MNLLAALFHHVANGAAQSQVLKKNQFAVQEIVGGREQKPPSHIAVSQTNSMPLF